MSEPVTEHSDRGKLLDGALSKLTYDELAVLRQHMCAQHTVALRRLHAFIERHRCEPRAVDLVAVFDHETEDLDLGVSPLR